MRNAEGLTGGIEPQAVGALIEDGTGAQWVRVHRSGGPAPWHRVDFRDKREPWSVWSAIPEPTYFYAPTTPAETGGGQ